MKLVVGLGNPGKEYVNTRHNIGYSLLDYLCDNEEFVNEKFNALYKEINIDGEKVMLIKPLTYMNLSGEAVRKYVSFYKINFNNILIIQDDLDMNLGKIKFVFNSSSGGHNGIKDIEKNLNSIADRFSAARRHHTQNVPAGQNRVDERLLPAAEGTVTKELFQQRPFFQS